MSSPVEGDKVGDALRRAVEALKRGEHVTAFELASEITRAEPGHAGAFQLQGQTLAILGRMKDARAALVRALALHPERAAVHAALGQVELDADALAAAIAYGHAVALDPGPARFHGGLGTALAAGGHYELATASWLLAIAREPENWAMQFSCGQALLRVDRIDDALVHLAEAARLKPGNWQVEAQFGVALARINRYEAALAPLLAAVRANPGSAHVQHALGQVLLRLGRFSDAISPLNEAVRLAPDSADTRLELGGALFRHGRLQESLDHVDTAMLLRPSHGPTHILRSHVLAGLDKPIEALREWCRAIKMGEVGTRKKVHFYPLARLFSALVRREGSEAGVAGAIEFLDALDGAEPPSDLKLHRPRTYAFLAAIAAESPQTIADQGIGCLLNGRPVDAMACFGKHLRDGGRIESKYDRVLVDGPDAGHPVWHLMNPFYHVWANAISGTEDEVQKLWKEEGIFAQGRSIAELSEFYAGWRRVPLVARDVLSAFLTGPGHQVRRVLDLGCGFGQWLVFFMTECGLLQSDLFGADFHVARVESCRLLLNQHFDQSGQASFQPENFFQCNAMTWNPRDFYDRNGAPDLVTLMAFTSVFDDDQLPNVLDRIARLEARYIFEYSPVDQFDLNHGRIDLSEQFLRVGYRQILYRLPGESAANAEPGAFIFPRKYWTAHQIGIYERI